MQKKYEILREQSLEFDGRQVFRIRALIDIAEHNVSEGDVGGYIQNESNLSQEHIAWVGDDAIVCDDAKVFENALVNGMALVSKRGWVYGNSVVSGRTHITDGAHICGESRFQQSYNCVIRGNAYICDDENFSCREMKAVGAVEADNNQQTGLFRIIKEFFR